MIMFPHLLGVKIPCHHSCCNHKVLSIKVINTQQVLPVQNIVIQFSTHASTSYNEGYKMFWLQKHQIQHLFLGQSEEIIFSQNLNKIHLASSQTRQNIIQIYGTTSECFRDMKNLCCSLNQFPNCSQKLSLCFPWILLTDIYRR